MFDKKFVDLCARWYDGSASMMYAVASSGGIERGTIRPMGEDGPMSDEEWIEDLFWSLLFEVNHMIRTIKKFSEHTDLPEDDLDMFLEFQSVIEKKAGFHIAQFVE